MINQLILKPKKKQKLTLIRQDELSDCGHACVAMIANFHGHNLSLLALKEIKDVSSRGTTLLELLNLLDKISLRGRALKVEINQFIQLKTPLILHWNMNHFVVLYKITKNYALIYDPAIGKRKITINELSKSFSGIALEVEPKDDFKPIVAKNELSLFDIFKLLKGLGSSLLVLVILSLCVELFVLINPLFLQYITDHIVNMNAIDTLYIIAIGFSFFALTHSLVEWLRTKLIIYLNNNLREKLSSKVVNHLLRLPLDYFEKRHMGDILSKFYSIQEIQNKLTTDSITTLLDGFIIVLSLLIMFFYSFKLTLIIIFTLSLYLIIRGLSYQYQKNQTELSVREHADVNTKLLEMIQGIMAIKIFAKEESIFRHWKNNFITALNADIRLARIHNHFQIATLGLFNLEHILVISLAAFSIMENQFSLGMLVAFLAYRQTLVNKSTSFIHKIYEYKLVSVQMKRMADILLNPIEEEDKFHIEQEIVGKIEVKNLSYYYPGSPKPTLKQVNFVIEPGEKVVITGTSGIGKTTLLKILLGLIKASEGQILIDECALGLLGIKHYRKACASVMQEDSLISGSILDNINFMSDEIDLLQIHKVCKMAAIHDDILAMPMGYETLISDMNTLSGGQRQRILIARALYKNPKILFLDEATSHLDMETEIKINQALKNLNITQVIIAHRQETIKMADRIIRLG
ncbi:MAG: peptidase domain-containing ABC transporter [Proteobacteria bacterium]|nr:peptidase domain-containing ABC transporter [Pseudomonadota bacterium]